MQENAFSSQSLERQETNHTQANAREEKVLPLCCFKSNRQNLNGHCVLYKLSGIPLWICTVVFCSNNTARGLPHCQRLC